MSVNRPCEPVFAPVIRRRDWLPEAISSLVPNGAQVDQTLNKGGHDP